MQKAIGKRLNGLSHLEGDSPQGSDQSALK
jgi:hypothetical protein